MTTDDTHIPPEQILPSLFRSNLLRTVLLKHIELNKMADGKANILMTAASIIIAVVVANFQNGDEIGMAIILASSILSVILAILVIIPKPYHHEKKCENLFYFRSFNQISEDQYVSEMKTLMQDKDAMYEHYIRDIYRYGTVTLTKKYRILTFALSVFLTGLTIGGTKILLKMI